MEGLKFSQLKKQHPYYIRWRDASFIGGGAWIWDLGDFENKTWEKVHPVSVGFLIAQDKEDIVICESRTPDSYSDATVIPKRNVVEIRRLIIEKQVILMKKVSKK